MFRYIFAFLILNSSYRSLGVPIPTNVHNLLTALANNCENGFLSEQLKSKLSYCAELSSPHGQKQLECLIFYDINKRLCSAVGASKLALTEDYSVKINEEQDVNFLCGSTEDWVFLNITEFPNYKQTADKVFKHSYTCGKICGVEDLTSDDANFFCKYFKWGTDMLKNQVSITSTQGNPAQPSEAGSVADQHVIPASNDLTDVQVKNVTISTQNEIPEVSSVKTEESGKSPVIKGAPISESIQAPEESGVNSMPDKPEIKNDNEDPVSAVDSPLTQNDPVIPDISNPSGSDVKKDAQVKKTESAQIKPAADDAPKLDVDKEIQLLNGELEHKGPVPELSKDKQPSDMDDYQDSDEGKEGLGDIQGDDDGDEPILDDINKAADQKPEEKQSAEHLKTVVSGFTGESVPGFYPSYGQDSYDDDDSDHFFSFFLTAVIMVVVIYVLYHNKNRVGKLFFGLILEGRQSGRRRNSRGHAYRRLDTLEQAMSTNTAAPPSKIIY